MNRTLGTWMIAVAACLAAAGGAAAQQAGDAKREAASGEEKAGPRLRVRFVETRQRGQATTSVELCSVSLHAGDKPAVVFAGAQVVMRTSDKGTPTVTFKNAGVQVHLGAQALGDGRYGLDASFEVAAPMSAGGAAPAGASNPTLKVIKAESRLVLREGETVPFASAVDSLTGEVVRVDVALDAAAAAKPAAPSGGSAARLRARFVVNRRHGDKTLASRPYSVIVEPGEEKPANVFSGAMLPLEVSYEGRPTVMLKDIGAGVRLAARRIADGRYRLDLSVSDGTLAPADGSPRVKTFQAESRLYLAEGERVAIASAIDPETGDVMEAELTLEGAR